MLYITSSIIGVDDWGPEGASGKCHHISWSHFDRVMFSNLEGLNKHLDGYQCPSLDKWDNNLTGDEPERYDYCYVGDENGAKDDNGKYIYDVSIYVSECELRPFVLEKQVSA